MYFSAAYGVVDKAYRGKGTQSFMSEQGMLLALGLGYPIVLSRTGITARTPVPSLKAGNQFLGVIPKSLHVPEFGWVDDLISWRDDSFKMTEDDILL